jgi:Right handed beta helix region
VVRNCRIHDNMNGIQFEVSDGGTFTDNVIWGNGDPAKGWYWQAGILVSSSRNVEIARNVLAYNLDGISVLSQDRSDRPADTSDKALLAFDQDWSGNLWGANTGNVGSANKYWSPYPEPRSSRFVWSSTLSTLAALDATPMGGGSTYLTTADKDAALASAGIPAR